MSLVYIHTLQIKLEKEKFTEHERGFAVKRREYKNFKQKNKQTKNYKITHDIQFCCNRKASKEHRM